MNTATRYAPPASGPAGLGGALLVGGLVVGGLFLAIAPTIVPRLIPDDGPIELIDPTLPKPDPKPEPKPTEASVARESKPYIPDPQIDSPTSETVIAGTDVPTDRPPLDPGLDTGTAERTVLPDPPRPLPPLVPAARDPKYARDFQPDYPASELRAQREGDVVVRVLVGIDGRVKAVEQVRAASPALFEATRRHALARWRFTPATRAGVPEESWRTMTVTFQIDNR